MGKKISVKIIAASIILSLCILVSSCGERSGSHQNVIPLKTGNYWIYEGKYNGRPVTMKITESETHKRGTLTFALLKGFPGDMLSGEDWEPSSWGLLVTGDQHYYKFNFPKTDSVKKAFLDSRNVLTGLFTDSEIFMEALYDTGQTFGEAAQLTREDGSYYWRVTDKHAFDASSIRELKLIGPFDRFTITNKTLADDIMIDMVPGIGIVRYRYSHHGTPAELDLKLMEAGLR